MNNLLVAGGIRTEDGVAYVVTRVDESRVPSGVAHAWVEAIKA